MMRVMMVLIKELMLNDDEDEDDDISDINDESD